MIFIYILYIFFFSSMLSRLSLIICLNIVQRVFWRGVVEELLWFISGSTNAKVMTSSLIVSESMCFFYCSLCNYTHKSNRRSQHFVFV